MADAPYLRSRYVASELDHQWGTCVHLLDDPLAWTLLAQLGSQASRQPEVLRLLRRLYAHLAWVVLAAEFPRRTVAVPTKLIGSHPEAVYRGIALESQQKAVTVGIARAGTVPSQVVYEMLCEALVPESVRQDHIAMSRVTDAQGHVTGATFEGMKVAGDVEDRIVMIPDPMGATGSSMCAAVDLYQNKLRGKPAKVIAMHLIVTPEYLRRVTQECPELVIYGFRYDRGLSPQECASLTPGNSELERGLNDQDYIVPGAGGLGEILNNAWI